MKKSLPVVLLMLLFVAIYIYVLFNTPVNTSLLERSFSGISIMTGRSALSPTVDTVLERQEIGRVASEYVRSKIPGQVFQVRLRRSQSDWALVDVLFLERLDQKQVLLQRKDGKWLGVALGEDLSSWKTLVPELFDASARKGEVQDQ